MTWLTHNAVTMKCTKFKRSKGSCSSSPAAEFLVATNDPGSFKLGNVEEAMADGSMLVSFRNNGTWRRSEPELIPSSRLIADASVDNFRYSFNNVVRGRRLILPIDRPFVQAVRCESELDRRFSTVIVRRLVLMNGTWEAYEDAIVVSVNDLYPYLFLMRVSQQSFLAPVHPAINALIAPVGIEEPIVGASMLHVDELRIPIETSLRFADMEPILEATADFNEARILQKINFRNRVRIESCEEPNWTTSHAVLSGTGYSWSRSDGFAPSKVSLATSEVRVELAPGAPLISRDIFVGTSIVASNCYILTPDPPLSIIPGVQAYSRGLQTSLLGRNVLLYKPPTNDSSMPSHSLALLCLEASFCEDELRVLSQFFTLLGGCRVTHVLHESFDAQKKLTVEYGTRSKATKQASPAIPLNNHLPVGYAAIEHLPNLLERMASVYRVGDSASLDAALHHYVEGVDSSYSVTRILRLSIAFEALVNLVTGDRMTSEKIIEDDTLFKSIETLLKSVLDNRDNSYVASLTSIQIDRLKTKIHNMNQASNTKRIRLFWTLLGVTHSNEDDELIRRLRNESTHNGYVSDDGEDVWKNYDDSKRLADMFNRCLLAYLGYEGPVRKADSQDCVHALTNEPYVVASI